MNKTLHSFISDAKIAIHDEKNFTQSYLQELGDIKAVLEILLKLNRAIYRIHKQGYALVNLTPENIIISDNNVVIDENIKRVINCDFKYNENISDYTHPEIKKGKKTYNTISDSWSFTVIAFELLTSHNPTLGNIKKKDDYWEYTTQGNHIHKINYNYIFSKRLLKLFDNLFIESNLDALPTIDEWFEKLHKIYYSLNKCSNDQCNLYFLFQKTCPYCGNHRTPFFLLKEKFGIYNEFDKEIEIKESKPLQAYVLNCVDGKDVTFYYFNNLLISKVEFDNIAHNTITKHQSTLGTLKFSIEGSKLHVEADDDFFVENVSTKEGTNRRSFSKDLTTFENEYFLHVNTQIIPKKKNHSILSIEKKD